MLRHNFSPIAAFAHPYGSAAKITRYYLEIFKGYGRNFITTPKAKSPGTGPGL
jgi:hypothetical protein